MGAWKSMKPLKFADFAITLGRPMLNYDPSAMMYAGEKLLTANLRTGDKHKAVVEAAAAARRVSGGRGNNKIVSPVAAVRYPPLAADLLSHMNVEEMPGGRKTCHNCGKKCCQWDPVCKVSLHRGCFVAYHDSSRRGFAWADTRCKGR